MKFIRERTYVTKLSPKYLQADVFEIPWDELEPEEQYINRSAVTCPVCGELVVCDAGNVNHGDLEVNDCKGELEFPFPELFAMEVDFDNFEDIYEAAGQMGGLDIILVEFESGKQFIVPSKTENPFHIPEAYMRLGYLPPATIGLWLESMPIRPKEGREAWVFDGLYRSILLAKEYLRLEMERYLYVIRTIRDASLTKEKSG